MNLLPKSVKEFGSKSYWDSFFQKRQNAFEWYGEYHDLCGLLHKYCKAKEHVLMAGCGNSQLSENLYDVGYRSIVNVDISDVVVNQMEARNKIKRQSMQFLKMDLLDLKFEDESFQVVLDKGTLDAIFTSEEEKIIENVNKIFAEISRVLKVGGRYICITLAQEHILKILLDYFSKLNWFIRVHKVDISSNSNESSLPIFAFILTKTRPNPNSTLTMPQILEVVADASDKVSRLGSTLEMKKSVQGIQEFAMVKQHLKTLHPQEHFQLNLWSEESQEEPRYSLTIVDQKHSKSITGKFAIFIVPQGREHEWMFSVKAGQEKLAISAGFQRLVIVALNRDHKHANLEEVKEELSGKVLDFAQNGVTSADQVPFLSIGEDVGKRRQVHRGKSAITGDYVIEDVERDGHETYRHLIFLAKKDLVQSEAKLCNEVTKIQRKSSKKKKGAKNKETQNVDLSYLACEYQHAIIAGFALSEKIKSSNVSLLLIGLGGGSLPMFIHSHFSQIHLTVVELDPDIVEVAKNWFDFQESERMKLVIGDGLQFIEETSSSTPNSSKYDMVIFDVDSKDASKALSCPPPQFVEEKTLMGVKSILNPGGLFILNLVCFDKEVKQEHVHTIQQALPQAYLIDIENEVNEVIICKNSETHEDIVNFVKDGQQLEQQITAISPATNVELADLLQSLKIV